MSKLPRGQTVLKSSKLGGRYSYAVATTAFGRFQVTLAALDDRAVYMAEMFAQYRIESVKISFVARETTMCHLAVFFNLPTAAAPTTIEEMEDCPFYANGSGLYGSPLPCVELKRKDLERLAQPKWFNTMTSSVDNEFEFQFEVWSYAPFATLNHNVRIEYVVSLTAPADPSQMMARISHSSVRELQMAARRGSTGILSRSSELCEGKSDPRTVVQRLLTEADDDMDAEIVQKPSKPVPPGRDGTSLPGAVRRSPPK